MRGPKPHRPASYNYSAYQVSIWYLNEAWCGYASLKFPSLQR